MATERPVASGATVHVVVAEPRGAITQAVRALDAHQLDADDLVLRRPTLDDVWTAVLVAIFAPLAVRKYRLAAARSGAVRTGLAACP